MSTWGPRIARYSAHLLEPLDLQTLVIQEDLDIPNSPRHIVDTLHQESSGIIVYASHPKALQVRREGYPGPLFALLVLRDLMHIY